MLAAEAGGDGTFFEGVVDCVAVDIKSEAKRCREGYNVYLRRAEELLKYDVHPSHHLG